MKRGPGTESQDPSKMRRRPRQKGSGGNEDLNLAEENSQTRRTRTGKSKHKEAWHSQRVLSQRGRKVQVRWWGGKQSNGCFYTDGRDGSLCVTNGNDPVQRGILMSRGKHRRTSGTWLSTGQVGKVSSGQGGTGLSWELGQCTCSKRENPTCLNAHLGTCGLLLPLLFSHQWNGTQSHLG